MFSEFCSWLRNGGWAEIGARYSALPPLLDRMCDNWIEAHAELLGRLRRDTPALVAAGLAKAGSSLETLASSGADPHGGGRRVEFVRFTDGATVVYKPRDVSMELAFARLVARPELGEGASLRAARVLSRPGYGWMEFVASRPCESEEQVTRAFEGAGALLCLMRVLGGSDCHGDNLVVDGEDLVLVDCETLLTGQLSLGPENAVPSADAFSVLDTYLLPRWESAPSASRWDVSGFGATPGQETGLLRRAIVNANTDAMRAEWRPYRCGGALSRVRLDERVAHPAEHEANLRAGYDAMHRALRQIARKGPGVADYFGAASTRYVFRPTGVYADLLARALAPQHLTDPEARRRYFADALQRGLGTPLAPQIVSLLEAEVDAMVAGDIPHFVARCDRTALRTSSRTLQARLARRPIDDFLARLAGLDVEARRRDLTLTCASLRLSRPPAAATRWRARPLAPRPTALAIADGLLDGGSVDTRDAHGWVGVRADVAGAPVLERLGLSLYDGAAGVALFYAAAWTVSGRDEHREVARAGLDRIGSALEAQDPVLAGLGLGVLDGLGGLLYATSLLRGVDADVAERCARRLMTLIDDRIGEATEADVASGLAGAAFALLTRAEAGDAAAARAAARTGDRLLATQCADGPEAGGWRALGGAALCGFAHGASGVAAALVRLRPLCDQRVIERSVNAALGFESRHRRSDGAWPDRRTSPHHDAKPQLNAWCHGAAGIGLSRSLTERSLAGSRGRQARLEREEALGTLGGGAAGHSLCCGLAGHLDVALRSARDEMSGRRSAVAGRLVRELTAAAAERRLMLDAPPEVELQPGLFRGLSGIGYSLLRAADPQHLPAVTAFDHEVLGPA